MFVYHHVLVTKDSLVPWNLAVPEFLHSMEGPIPTCQIRSEGKGLSTEGRGHDSVSFKASNEISAVSPARGVKCMVFIIDPNSVFIIDPPILLPVPVFLIPNSHTCHPYNSLFLLSEQHAGWTASCLKNRCLVLKSDPPVQTKQ